MRGPLDRCSAMNRTMEHRIVSLIASATEIVCALGYESSLVGRSHECDFPSSVERLPVCSEPRIDVHGSSRQIDDDVRNAVREALSVYSVFADELERLQPTLIVTQTQCEVCAVSLRDVEAAVCRMVSSAPRIVSLEAMDLNDVWKDILQVARALDDEAAGRELFAARQARLRDLQSRVSGLERPTMACIEWLDPLMIAGNWVPELVEIAGGVAVLGEAGKHSPYLSWEDLVAADPDVIAVMPCGFDIPRTARELHLLTEHAAWKSLRAVRTGRVFLTDGNQYFNRPGPRLVESAEILAELLHPGRFDFGHESRGWIPVAV